MKRYKVVIAALAVSLLAATPTLAAQWQQNETGWWWQNDDGSYPTNQWQEIDGKQYYFNESGYMLSNTTTPDGYTVDSSGAWIQDGAAQTEQGLTASYGQYSINPLIFEEMNNPAKKLYEKYANNSGYEYVLGASYNNLCGGSLTISDTSFPNAPFSEYTLHIYKEPKKEGYVPELDLNKDGVLSYQDELLCFSQISEYFGRRDLENALHPYLHDTKYYDWEKNPTEIKSTKNVLLGFGDTCSVEEIGRIVKLMGATDVEPVHKTKQKEISVMRTGMSGGLYWENTGRYETIDCTSIGFTIHGLKFYANGTYGMINTNTDKWTIKPVE